LVPHTVAKRTAVGRLRRGRAPRGRGVPRLPRSRRAAHLTRPAGDRL